MFAISCNSRFLLSTSAAPPTIYLTNLILHTVPVLLRPYCSSSSVVAAAFHPENEDFFLLAFADGTAAVFDALHFFNTRGKSDNQKRHAIAGSGGEIAFIKGLHASGTSVGGPDAISKMEFDGYDPGTGVVGIGNRAAGITAVAFVPGRSATAVTVGADGKCCVVDFTQLNKQKAVLLRSWHVRRPATSLSIICYSKLAIGTPFGGKTDMTSSRSIDETNEAYYIAIGRQDGKVLLYDLNGKPLGHQTLDADGCRIIDVEWTQVDGRSDSVHRPRTKARPSVPQLPVTVTTNKGQGRSVAVQDHRQQDQKRPGSSETHETVNPLFDFSTPRRAPEASRSRKAETRTPKRGTKEDFDATDSAACSADAAKERKKTPSANNEIPVSESYNPVHARRVSESSAKVTGTTSEQTSPAKSPPPIPPRPRPKPGGRLSKRRAQRAYQSPTYLGVVSEARRMGSNPRVTGVVYGPRQAPSPRVRASKSKTSSSSNPASMTMAARSDDADVEWTDAASDPAPEAVSISPQVQPPYLTPFGATMSPLSSDSRKSYKTAYSYLTSEASDDTVVTWSAGLARRPMPTLQPTPRKEPSPKALGTFEPKGHISLSVNSTPREAISPSSSASNDQRFESIAHSACDSTRKPIPKLQLTHATSEWPQRQGYISIPVSADTTEAQTPISADLGGRIVQWPSLKKSPGIPELHGGLPDPSPESSPETVKESVTGIVIKGYERSPSPSKPQRPRPSHIPLPPSTSVGSDIDHHPHCACAATVEAVLEKSMAALGAEVKRQLEAQRVWFEQVVRGEKNERNMMVENRWLRNELARVERGRIRVGVDGMGRGTRDV